MENNTKICPYCGQVMSTEEEFCSKCGQMYVVPQQQVYSTNNNAQQQGHTANNNMQQAYATPAPAAETPVAETPVAEAPVTEAPVAEAPVAEAPAEEPPKKKKTGLIIGIVVGVIVVAALVVAGIFVGPKLFNKGDDKKTEDVKSKKSGPKKQIMLEDGTMVELDENTYLLEMCPDTKMKESELKDVATVIENRVKVLGEDYTLTTDNGKISLTINQEMLGSTPAERAHNLRLIESNGKNAVMNSGTSTLSWSFGGDNIKSLEVETLDKDDFVKANKKYFSKPNLKAFEDISEDEINVIYATVDSIFAETIEEALDWNYSDETLVIATDIVGEEVSEMLSDQKVMDIVPVDEDDYTEFYIVSPQAQSKKNAELIVNILENKGFDGNLDVRLVAEPEWETNSVVMVDNQVENIDGDAVTYEYTPSAYALSYMEGEKYDKYIKSVKDRLNALGVPFAFGYTGIQQETLVVKISPEKMSSEFGRLIFGTRSVSIYTQFKELSSYIGDVEVIEDHNGAPALKVTMSKTKEELYATYSMSQKDSFAVSIGDEEVTEIVDDGKPKPIYLIINDINVASADLSDMSDDKTIIFSNFLFAGDEKITSDDADVLNMFVAATETSTFVADGNLDDDGMNIKIRHYDGINEVNDEIKWGYDPRNDYDNDMIKKVKDKGHKMTLDPGKRNTAVIELNVKIDDDLPENFCDAVKTVYQDCGFDDGAYAGVLFKIKNEKKKSTKDECRIEFSKDSYDKVGLTFMESVTGPTFSDYWYDVYTILEEDEFFVEKARY